MSKLVRQLRGPDCTADWTTSNGIMAQAADEIERLQAFLSMIPGGLSQYADWKAKQEAEEPNQENEP